MPLESLLGALVVPYGRRAAALEDEVQVFIEMPHWIQFFAGGNLADIGACCSFGAVHIDECAVTASACPGFKVDFLQILNKKSLDNWNPLAQLPFIVKGDV